MNLADKIFDNIENIANESTERKNPVDKTQKTFNTENIPLAEFVEDTTENIESKKIDEVSKKAFEVSGKTGAFLTAGLIETVFGFTERMVFIKKFSADEKQRLAELDGIVESEFSEFDGRLNRKFLAISKKHEKIKSEIDLKKDEIDALEIAFAEYAKITGKSLDPTLIVWSTIAKIFVSRSMDIFL